MKNQHNKDDRPIRNKLNRMMEQLEDRILFDAVPDGGFLVEPDPNTEVEVEQTVVTERNEANDVAPRELILVDSNVHNPDELISEILQNQQERAFEIHLLSADKDGVHQITELLGESSATYSAIHILSHGSEGSVQLGDSVLNSSNLSSYASDLLAWTDQLTENADILFYGCNLAGNSEGEVFAETFSTLTGADVAASDDLTGHASLGGDWELEHEVGRVETQALSIANYFATFNTFTIRATSAVTVNGDGGVGTSGTWSNAGFLDTDPTVDADNDGDFENDQDLAVDVVATVVGVTGTVSVDFETVSTTDPNFDDMRARVSGDGTATIRWEMLEAGTSNRPSSGRIGLTISDIDGTGGNPNTVEGVSASLHNLSSYTLQSPTNLDVTVDSDFLEAQGTQNQNDEQPSWVRFDWASANELVLTYHVYDNGTRFFNHDGDGDLVFTNPNTNFTQSLDLDADNSSGASGSNYQTTYIDGSIPGANGDVPVAIADADISIFDINDTMLEGATIVLTNASTGDLLNVNAALMSSLGISANVDTSVAGRIEVTLSGTATIDNYETAIQSITYSNDSAAIDKNYVRLLQIWATDGENVTGVGETTIDFSNAINAPTASPNFFVVQEDSVLDATAQSILDNDDDPQGDTITLVSAQDSAGNHITIGANYLMPSGATLLLLADGSFQYMPAEHFSGAEFFNYTIEDPSSNSATSFVTINVRPIADTPVLGLGYNSATINEDALSPILNINATTPDNDGSEQVEVIVSGLLSGSILTDGTNSFTASGTDTTVDISSWDLTQIQYQSAPHSDRDQTITVTVNTVEPNGDTATTSQNVAFTVDAVADAPNLTATNQGTGENQPIALNAAIDVSVVDTDGSETITDITISNIPVGAQILDGGTPLTITGGAVSITQTQLANLTFVPPTDFLGTVSLFLSATSTETAPENGVAQLSATSGPIQLDLTFDVVDDPVTAYQDVGVVASGGSVSLNVTSNDQVPDGGAVVVSVDGQAISVGQTITLSSGDGDVTLVDAQSLSFAPSNSATDTITFSYTVADADGDTDSSNVSVSVIPPLVDDAVVLDQDTTVTIDVLNNDPQASVLPATITSITAVDGSHGVTSVNGNGTIDYTPDAGFSGTDSFDYQVTGLAGGLQYQFFDGVNSWNSVDNIPAVDPDYVGIANDLDSAALSNSLTGSGTDYGVRYSGFVYIDTPDNYNFSLQSNNGSRLYVEGQLVADNDNSGGTTSNLGSVWLESGYHEILLEHYDFGGGAALTARIEGADTGGNSLNLLASGRVGSAVLTQTATVDLTINDTQAPSSPTVTITEDANNDGQITSSELAGDIDVSIALPGDAVVGDTLTVFDGSTTQNFTLTATDISNGTLTTTFASPGIGNSITVSAYLTDAAGNVGASDSDSALLNDSPIAENDDHNTFENQSVSNNVLGNDNDPNGDTLSVGEVDGVAGNVGLAVTGTGGGEFTIDAQR